VEANVAKDLLIAGGTVNVRGEVGEDLMISGGEIHIEGDIGDDVRVFGGEMNVSGKIEGDLLVFGGDIRIEESAEIRGMLKVYGGSVFLAGKVQGGGDVSGGEFVHKGHIGGDLRGRTGRTHIAGRIDGKSILASRTLDLSKGAVFEGDVRYWRRNGEIELEPYLNGSEAVMDPALKGQVMGDVGWTTLMFGFWAAWIIYILSAALILFLLNFLLTRSFKRAGIALEHLGKSLGFGALYVIGTPIAVIILLLTVIGAPIALVAGSIWGLSMLFTHLLSAVVITHWLKVRYNKAWDRAYLFLVSLGIYLVIKGVSLIPIIGWIVSLILVMASFGAILLARRALFTNRPMVRL
jgi:cytoskeletal protein CcmA (bactofilin family)